MIMIKKASKRERMEADAEEDGDQRKWEKEKKKETASHPPMQYNGWQFVFRPYH